MKEVPMPHPCACGCGDSAKAGNRFIRGHWSRTTAAQSMYAQRRASTGMANPTGFCECGCGGVTPIATENRASRGYYKGEHARFIKGHGQRAHRGPKNAAWKGGRLVTPSGYVYLYAPDHPHANARGYIYEHRAIVEQRLGRILAPGERVHHQNHQRGDNRDENLILFASHSDHVKTEHPQALSIWKRDHPEQAALAGSKAGRLGSAARWRKK